jgi:methylmalonic aciduria homocystinuria type C protein
MRLRQRCDQAGFDLAAACRVGAYNQGVSGELKLDDFGSPEHLAIVVGNSRALWRPFVAALRSDPALLKDEDPLDRYTEATIGGAVGELGYPASVRWAHDVGRGLVAIQRLAHVAGLAYLSPSHLSVHRIYGPWVALRAAITFDVPGPSGPGDAGQSPCGDCAAICLPAFERARTLLTAQAQPASPGDEAWRQWLACRDACRVGREHRYTDDQIAYHYGKDREILVGLAAAEGE